MTMALIKVGHVALTVTELARSKRWYAEVMGWTQVFEGEADGVRFSVGALPDGGPLLGLREYDVGSGDPFDPARTGLDHLAFEAASIDELSAWEKKFAERSVDFTPTQATPYGHVLNFKDPDQIALEITVPPQA
jgi:glyoxylase I family protein